jgi:uncharacterized Tic20 family protein
VPFGNVIGPLIVWQLKKQEMPEIEEHGKEAVNFQISVTIYMIVSVILVFVVIGIIFLPVILLGSAILQVIAAIEASNGRFYRYPLTIRLIK